MHTHTYKKYIMKWKETVLCPVFSVCMVTLFNCMALNLLNMKNQEL